MHVLPDPERTRRMTTDELRGHFLVQNLFQPGRATYRFTDLDRVVLGGIVPTDAPIALDTPAELAAEHFAERREIGLLNVGAPGAITVDGERFEVGRLDLVYVGRGAREVSFVSTSAGDPAWFYLVSYPAHTSHPTVLVRKDEADVVELGTKVQANVRTLSKYVRPGGVESAQLVMGVTQISEGSVWNTMPAHTHARRTEVYLYVDLAADAVVIHLMGEPQEIRPLIVRDGEAVLSPGWSIHSGAGTGPYTFCWAMGGENQDFGDMQGVPMEALR